MRVVDLIVIHCSATPNGRAVSVSDIDGWHHARGFSRADEWRRRQNPNLFSIGYHFVVYVNGAVATGRHLEEIGAHVVGNNRTSIGVCMVGTDRFTREQWAALARNIGGLLKLYPEAKVRGHRDLSPDKNNDGLVQPWEWLKTCPGFDVRAWGKADFTPAPENILERNPDGQR